MVLFSSRFINFVVVFILGWVNSLMIHKHYETNRLRMPVARWYYIAKRCGASLILWVLLLVIINILPVYAENEPTNINIELNPSSRIEKIKSTNIPIKEVNAVSKLSLNDESWRLPFSAGTSIYHDQGYNGTFSHKGVYALDMRAPNGTIVSARNGWISTINFGGKWNQWCNSNTDCYNKGGVWRGNHIIISHSDGSTSFYLHMAGNSLQPDLWVGKYIDQGTPLGIEGSTGYTCLDLVTPCKIPDPHLHFQVNKNGVSIPTFFDDCNLQGNRCANGVPIEGSTNMSTNLRPWVANNIRTDKINYFGSEKAIKMPSPFRGQVLRLGGEKENSSSNWEWLSDGQIKGLNEWCLSGELNQIVVRDCTGKANQKWYRGANNSIRNIDSGMCWDSYSGDSFDSLVYLFGCHGGANQRWRIGSEPYPANAS